MLADFRGPIFLLSSGVLNWARENVEKRKKDALLFVCLFVLLEQTAEASVKKWDTKACLLVYPTLVRCRLVQYPPVANLRRRVADQLAAQVNKLPNHTVSG